MRAPAWLRSYLPGVVLLAAGAVLAYAVAGLTAFLDPLVVAVGVGFVVGNAAGIPSWAEQGVTLQVLFLETGIVLLGASVTVAELLDAGPLIAVLIAATVVFGVVFVEAVSRLAFRLTGSTPSLLAAGASICGVSAVAAIGQVIDAREDRIALVAATVLLFDAVTLVAFPLAGQLLDLTGVEFGVWAGLSMFSTGPVAAAGFAHSPEAGQWATVTKLARNSFLGLVAIGYSVAYSRRGGDRTASAGDPSVRRLWSDFPKFLVGFLLVAVIANAGLLSPASVESIGTITDWLFVLAFVGLGAEIEIETMREAGPVPVIVVLLYLLAVAAVSLAAVQVVF
jgi:uncharacterized integral membrane protein (TIGR00698 family)